MLQVWRNYWIAIALLGLAVPIPSLVGSGQGVPLQRPFGELGYEIGEWRGRDEHLSDRVRELLGTSDILLRDYTDPLGHPVGLYVSYFARQQRGETSHSPQNCLPGAGWLLLESRLVSYPGDAASGATINELVYERAGHRQLVYYWFRERTRIVASEYWVKWYLIWDAITRHRTNGALIRVSVPVVDTEAAARQRGLAFMQLALPQLEAFLPS